MSKTRFPIEFRSRLKTPCSGVISNILKIYILMERLNYRCGFPNEENRTSRITATESVTLGSYLNGTNCHSPEQHKVTTSVSFSHSPEYFGSKNSEGCLYTEMLKCYMCRLREGGYLQRRLQLYFSGGAKIRLGDPQPDPAQGLSIRVLKPSQECDVLRKGHFECLCSRRPRPEYVPNRFR